MRYESDGKGPRYEPTPDWALRHMNKGRKRNPLLRGIRNAFLVETAIAVILFIAWLIIFW